MKLFRTLVVCAAVSSLPMAMAQKWEFGGGAGGGFYASNEITSPGGSAAAKVKSNFSAGAWIGSNSRSTRWGGELRYDYQKGDLQLKNGSTEALFGAETHAMHYDLTYHFADEESRVRPFVAAGAGIKIYRGTGQEQPFQPLSKVALLTKAQDLTPLVSVGLGFKVQLATRWQLRVDVHDYLTPFPKQVITPNGGNVSGWVNNIVPMVGLSFTD